MKYKILSLILGTICIVLAINFYRLQKKQDPVTDCGHSAQIEDLNTQKAAWLEREDEFLKQNALLVTENNELKMQLNRKPLIIYKDAQTPPINDGASDYYTSILSGRYK
jgi:hypothetical protein